MQATQTIDQEKIGLAIAEIHAALPKQSEEMVNGLDELQGQYLDKLISGMVRIAEKKSYKLQPDNTQELAGLLRHDKIFLALLKITLDKLRREIIQRLYGMQDQTYEVALKSVAKIWDDNTVKGIKFAYKIEKNELNRLHGLILYGLSLPEWVDGYVQSLNRKILAIMTMFIAQPTGEGMGKKTLFNRIETVLAKVIKDCKELGKIAINQANNAAFDAENELFADEGQWGYN